jgi:hypothetical protein
MNRLVMSQPNVMTGISRKVTDLQCFSMYARGSSTPTAKHCTTRTMRENSRVIKSTFPHVAGSIRFAACGPKMMPHSVATVASPMYRRSLITEEHSMNRLVKPPRITYTKCGFVMERWSHAIVKCWVLCMRVFAGLA